jgi:transcription elongation factor
LSVGTGVRSNYAANDLVSYDSQKHAGLVLQVHEDYLKVINEQGKIVTVKLVDIIKKLPVARTLGVRDKNGNALAIDHMVKVQ